MLWSNFTLIFYKAKASITMLAGKRIVLAYAWLAYANAHAKEFSK